MAKRRKGSDPAARGRAADKAEKAAGGGKKAAQQEAAGPKQQKGRKSRKNKRRSGSRESIEAPANGRSNGERRESSGNAPGVDLPENAESWKRLEDAIGVAGGTWNLEERPVVRPGKDASSTSTSTASSLPRVEPIVVSYEGLGAYLLATSGPVLRVHRLPEGKCGPEGKCRAHEGTIVALVAVPAAVNRLQAMTLAECMTLVLWDVAGATPLARMRVENLVALPNNQKFRPLSLALGVGAARSAAPHAIGWLCLQAQKESGSKAASVFSFPMHLKDVIRVSAGGGRRGKGGKGPTMAAPRGKKRVQSALPNDFKSSYTGGLVSCCDARTIFLWRSGDRPEDCATLHHTKMVTALAVSPDEERLAVGDEKGQVLIYNLRDEPGAGASWSIQWPAAHRTAGSGSKPHQTGSGRVDPATFHWHSSAVLSLEWGVKDDQGLAQDIHYLYSGGRECTLVIWELPLGKRSYLPRFPAPLVSLKGCHSQREEQGMESLVAVGCADNSIVVVNVVTKARVCNIAGLQVPYDTVVSLGKNAATGHAEISLYASRRGLLQKYDLDQDREVGKLSVSYNHDQAPFSASPTKGGKTKPRAGSKLRPANKKAGSHGATGTLISYCANESHLCTVEQSTAGMNIWIKFWIRDSETAKYEVETTLLNPHDKRVTCVVGHKSKPVVVTSSVDGKLKIWSRSPESGEWVCACQTSAPCTYLTAACFNASGDVLAACFGDNIGFWSTSDLELMTVIKCLPSQGIQRFESVALIPEEKPAFVVGTWKAGGAKGGSESQGVSVWSLLALRHAWSIRFEGRPMVRLAPLAASAGGGEPTFALSVATGTGGGEKGSTKVYFFSCKSHQPERVWHVSAYATGLFALGGEVVVGTRDGRFLSQTFKTKAQPLAAMESAKGKAKAELAKALAANAGTAPEATEEINGRSENEVGPLDASAGIPALLGKYQNTASHDLPPMSALLQGLLQ